MKKLYYCDEYIERPIVSQRDDSENERRKQLSIETNRRRREMAMKVKKEIDKEEKRRSDILKQRRDYQNSLNDKLHRRCAQRSTRTTSVQQLTVPDLDRTLTALRSTMPSSSLKQRAQSSEDITRYNSRPESAWADRREVCASPMLKYSGQEGNSKLRDNGHFLKTFETKLIEQEEAFRHKQNMEMNQFSRILNDTVFRDLNVQGTKSAVDEGGTYRVNRGLDEDNRHDMVECLDDDCDIEDSLDGSCVDYDGSEAVLVADMKESVQKPVTKDGDTKLPPPPSEPCKQKSDPPHLLQSSTSQRMQSVSTSVLEPASQSAASRRPPPPPSIFQRPQSQTMEDQGSQPQCQPPGTIKSILKKAMSNNCGSNPDIANSGRAAEIRDSVEITKSRSSRLFRSSSFSQGLDNQRDSSVLLNKDSPEEDANKKYVRFAEDSAAGAVGREAPRAANMPGDRSRLAAQQTGPLEPERVPADQKVLKTFSVPGSTPLKPPLHPRSTQEGSYLQTTIKKALAFQPPPRPQKISVESLDKQLEPLIHPKRAAIGSKVEGEKPDERLWDIAVDKTPTEKEIEQLWAEVRECLSKSRTPSKPESVGLRSGRTVDSGSGASVMSAPAWQRSTQRGTPFMVRHHRPWPGKEVAYPGQETPIKDEITVHSHGDHSPASVTQQPLSVISQRDRGFQAVSESLEEFLSLEGSCGPAQVRRFPLATAAVFMPRPPCISRVRAAPGEAQKDGGVCTPRKEAPSLARTQMSLDEDKLKRSLDRLNERLKNMSTLA